MGGATIFEEKVKNQAILQVHGIVIFFPIRLVPIPFKLLYLTFFLAKSKNIQFFSLSMYVYDTAIHASKWIP